MKIAILHHNDCDGIGAAYAAHCGLSANHELLFKAVQYGEDPPYDELRAFEPQQVYILDFSYKSNVLKDLMAEFSVVVIDHHKSAAEDLADFPEIDVVTFHEQDGVQYPIFRGVRIFQENSGCVLAWLFFMPDTEVPEILLYAQDYDLWKFELEHSKEINAFIQTLPFDFEEWADFYTPGAYDAGTAILRFQSLQEGTATISVGEFNIRYNKAGELWINHYTGEGMSVDPPVLAAAIRDFYTKHF